MSHDPNEALYKKMVEEEYAKLNEIIEAESVIIINTYIFIG